LSDAPLKEAVCLLAGGRGRRMGGEKCGRILCGRRLIEWALEAARGTGLKVFVAGGEPIEGEGATFLRDEKGEGPIAGLLSCLRRCERVVLLPCDMPFLTSELLRFLLRRAEGLDLLAPEVGGRLQPQVGVYGRACLPIIERNIERGELSLLALFEEPSLRRGVVGEEEVRKFGDPGRLFLNLNTEEDLRRAEGLIGRWGGGLST